MSTHQPGTPCDRGECRCGNRAIVISKLVPPAKPAERKKK